MKKKHQGPEDTNEAAFRVTQEMIRRTEGSETPEPSAKARAGRIGGLRGGNARKEALSPERRSEIAKKAAEKRWGKKAEPEEV